MALAWNERENNSAMAAAQERKVAERTENIFIVYLASLIPQRSFDLVRHPLFYAQVSKVQTRCLFALLCYRDGHQKASKIASFFGQALPASHRGKVCK